MANEGLEGLQSAPVPTPDGPFAVTWEPLPGMGATVYCRLQVPIGPDQLPALLAGSLDLMMERTVLHPSVDTVSEPDAGGYPHRLLIARSAAGWLSFIPTLAFSRDAPRSTPSLSDFGPPVDDWQAALRVGTPPPRVTERPAEQDPNRVATATIAEPGYAGKRAPTFIERPISVKEGRARRSAPPPPRTPLEAYERKVKPKQVRAAPLPDKETIAKDAEAQVKEEAPPSAPLEREDAAITWVVLASPDLLQDPTALTATLRLLRGYFKLALTGVADRGHLVRRAERCGVPFDAIAALPSDSARLAEVLTDPPPTIAMVALADDPTPANLRRIEVTRRDVRSTLEALVEDVRSRT